ncbi:hypothetical protein ACB092_09G195900 [Castanea dentata]
MYLFIFVFFSLHPKAKIFTGIPCKNGFLYTFTFEPSLSQCLQQKTSPFHSTLLSPPGIVVCQHTKKSSKCTTYGPVTFLMEGRIVEIYG